MRAWALGWVCRRTGSTWPVALPPQHIPPPEQQAPAARRRVAVVLPLWWARRVSCPGPLLWPTPWCCRGATSGALRWNSGPQQQADAGGPLCCFSFFFGVLGIPSKC